VTPRTLSGIALRVLDSAAKAAVVGDLFRIYAASLHEDAGFHWVTLPDGIEISGNEFFDPVKMKQLYDIGFQAARAESVWDTLPPGWRLSARPMVKPDGAPDTVPAPLPEGAPGSDR
jgi:hypothetical protein